MSFLTHIRANSRAALDFDGQSALRHRRRRGSKQVIIASCSLFLLVFLTGLYLAAPIDSTSILPFVTGHFRTTPSATDVLSPSAAVLRGHYNSTGKLDLQSRLVEGKFYLTSAVLAGWTNQVMSIAHILELAIVSKRIPILPSFFPHSSQLGYPDGGPLRLDHSIPYLPVSKVFDLPFLFSALSVPDAYGHPGLEGIVEWNEILDSGEGWEDDRRINDRVRIGCWTAWKEHDHVQTVPQGLRRLGLEPDYTLLPAAAKDFTLIPSHINLPSIEPYLIPGSTTDGLAATYLQELNSTGKILPDEALPLSCIDTTYYMNIQPGQWIGTVWTQRISIPGEAPAPWNVAKHMRWESKLLSRGLDVAREIFDVPAGEVIPGFVSIHMRHGDFLTLSCPFRKLDEPLDSRGHPPYDREKCLPLSMYSYAVDQALEQLALATTVPETTDIYPFDTSSPPKNVLITTDSIDPDILAAIHAKGWKIVPQELSDRLRREDGDWMPTLIDIVLLSFGRAFVGTAGSTLSTVNALRVEDWNLGPPSSYINWFSPTA